MTWIGCRRAHMGLFFKPGNPCTVHCVESRVLCIVCTLCEMTAHIPCEVEF